MRYVLGFFPPDRLFAIVDALSESHAHGLTISDARGFGQEHDVSHPEHREHLGVEMTKKIRVEIVCRDDEADVLVDALYRAGHTGRRGDGKVFVLPVLEALRVKTGERGEAALGPSSGE
ncbi:MAG TPA: P-II family nitrogen regulator [Thermoanaerobaculia bacterium]|nr:P-II family nitrogen regulator [Thermoanaerobaculia bacterium]